MAVRMTKSIGLILLAIWLVLTGVIPIISLSFEGLDVIMAALAIGAGVFILIGR